MKENNTWYYIIPPNISLLKCELGTAAQTYLWQQVEKAQIKRKNANIYLAGNISESIYLEDSNDYFFNNHLKEPCERYIQEYYSSSSFRNPFSNVGCSDLVLQEFWVNYSKKHEFNPIHSHGGALSFVIWMKIPTRSEEQHNLPISKNTSSPSSSDFQFLYTDILGSIQGMTWEMDPEIAGTMVVFPAMLAHQVYPFFECDDTRISIAGNLYFSTDVFKQEIDPSRGAPIHKNML
tara:strand:+ start:687 stop:1391 length:705 start_codon:yes stop_codon:yes gene_type:complete